jgi:hypothetical protein
MTSATDAHLPAAARFDLRRTDIDDVLARVQQALDTRLDLERAVRKRRSVGAPTSRGTWVRIELRGVERLDGQGWGTEATAVFTNVAAPTWLAGLSWTDHQRAAVWRADETTLIPDPPIGRATAATNLPDRWWATLNASLDALAAEPTTRRATPDCEPMTQERVTSTIDAVFPGQIDMTIDERAPAHADLNWANLTAPNCWILDWEDFGLAPRGLDAACLWSASLAVPDLAARIRRDRAADLEGRTGRIMALYYCAHRIALDEKNDPALNIAAHEANRLIKQLRQ